MRLSLFRTLLFSLALGCCCLPAVASEGDLKAEMDRLKKEVEDLRSIRKELEELRNKDSATNRAIEGDGNLKAEMDRIKKEVADLRGVRKELEELRNKDAATKPVGAGALDKMVDKMVDGKYGPNVNVSTKQGKLTIGGLLQVWYYSIQNDNLGFFGDRTAGLAGGDTNEYKDNDSFAIRRAELKFTMDIHENVQAVVMIDPAAGFTGRPSFNSNLGTTLRNATATARDVAADGHTTRLQDAYILYHGVVPHHDFQIGQFKPFIGNEGIASSAGLRFVERSMIGQLGDQRDIGLGVHGTWLDDRVQYWLGTYNSPDGFIPGTSGQNRADNNDEKSFAYRVLARPVWKDKTWGSLELGMSSQFNVTGEAGGDTLPDGTDGLGIRDTDNIRHYAWAEYSPGGPVKGWWLQGEYAWMRGRMASGVWALDGSNWTMATSANQTSPRALDRDGWFVASGYKLSDSIFADDLPSWFKPFEFAARYETFGNIVVADLAMPNQRHDVWNTSVYTAGVNYYIKGNNAKIQFNYNWVNEPDQAHDGGVVSRRIHEVENDNFMVNFQVSW